MNESVMVMYQQINVPFKIKKQISEKDQETQSRIKSIVVD